MGIRGREVARKGDRDLLKVTSERYSWHVWNTEGNKTADERVKAIED